uniref:Kelch-like protein diablo n=1 Tax=Strigamia maritima TaxID=126957 RepID=T1JDR2_STRMM
MCTIQVDKPHCPDTLVATLDEIRMHHFTTRGDMTDEMRVQGTFTDISLACGARVFTAHKAVLCASSPYFKELLGGGDENSIELEGVDPDPMEELLHFMYTGYLTVSAEEKERLKSVLFVADFLQMREVYDFCCCQILQAMSMQAFLEAWDIANTTNNEEMECEVIKYLGRNFRTLHKAKEFPELSLERMCALLTCSTLTVPAQDTVLRAVLTWLKHQDKECIDTYLLTLLPLIKFQDVSLECLQELLEEDPLVCDYPELERSITRAISLRFLKGRVCNRGEEVFQPLVALVVQMKDNSLVMLRYDIKKGIWLNPERLPLPKLQRYELIPRVVSVQDCKVYIVGGRAAGNCLNSMYMYNTATKTIHTARNMFNPRAGHGVCNLNGSIYVAGGFNSCGYIHCVERYEPEDDHWTSLAPLSETKVGISLAALNDRLYCVGGWDGERGLTSTECYDPAVNQWTRVACLPNKRYGMGAAGVDGRLFVMGGREDTDKWVTKDAMLVYDPSSDRWCATDTNVPFCPDEYFMVVWKQQIWLASFKGKQLLSYDSVKDQMIRPEQASYLRDCWGPLGIVMLNKNI